MSKSFTCFKQICLINLLHWKNDLCHRKLFNSQFANTAIDSFTENLTIEKGLKWDRLCNDFDRPTTISVSTNILKNSRDKDTNTSKCEGTILNVNELIKNLNKCVKCNRISDLTHYLEQCKHFRYCPTKEQLLICAKLFAFYRNKDGIQIIQNLCMNNYPSEYNAQSQYNHFKAYIIWTEGNIKESLVLFDIVYSTNVEKRHEIKNILCNCFDEIILNHGEASRILVSDFVKMVANKYNDFILMAYFWKSLFQSEWFTDQQLSHTLFKENNQLKKVVEWMVPNMGRKLIKEHKIDTLYRLIELLLINKMHKQCEFMLRLLFDYRYNANDLQGCSSVVKACVEVNISLSERQQQKFLQLLLNIKPSHDNEIKEPTDLRFRF